MAAVDRPDRRKFLRGAGIGLALPMLEAFAPRRARGGRPADDRPRRLVCAGTYLGFHQPDFFPAQTGRDYELPPVLQPLLPLRGRTTVFSGLDHRGRNGHQGWKAWMTGSAAGGVSLDQVVAPKIGAETRFESLQVTCGKPPADARISFTEEGIALPMIGRPSVLYGALFGAGGDKARLDSLLAGNRSILDGVRGEARALERRVGAADREKLGEYFASLRGVEKKLARQRAWLDKPTPQVEYPLPEFDPVAPDLALECESIMYDLMALALTTDSTRVLTFMIPGWSQVFTIGGRRLSAGYHGLSHHGNDPAKIAEYNLVGREHVKRFAAFLERLQANRDAAGRPLLDTTVVVFGSGMGNANTHDNSNLPTLAAGGGFRRGAHWKIERGGPAPRLLGDLYLTVMQQFGIEIERFAGAESNLNEYLA